MTKVFETPERRMANPEAKDLSNPSKPRTSVGRGGMLGRVADNVDEPSPYGIEVQADSVGGQTVKFDGPVKERSGSRPKRPTSGSSKKTRS